MRFLLSSGTFEGTRYLSEEALLETRIPAIVLSAKNTYLPNNSSYSSTLDAYALAWLRGTYRGYDLFSHNGGTLGHSTFLHFLPGVKIGFFATINSVQGEEHFVETQIAFHAFDLLLGFNSSDAVNAANLCKKKPFEKPLTRPIDPPIAVDRLRPYRGSFWHVAHGWFNVTLRETPTPYLECAYNKMTGHLVYVEDNKFSLYFTGTWALLTATAAETMITFRRSSDAVVGVLVVLDTVEAPAYFSKGGGTDDSANKKWVVTVSVISALVGLGIFAGVFYYCHRKKQQQTSNYVAFKA
jgi:hypothetical protein